MRAIAVGKTKAFAGFATALIHRRARMSDIFHCCEEPFVDLKDQGEGFIEVSVVGTKTSHFPVGCQRYIRLLEAPLVFRNELG